jgi:hypothetical protein
MQTIDIYRNGSLLATIKPDNNAVQVKRIMGENELRMTFTMNAYVDFQINDYCTVFSEIYRLNHMPLTKKSATNRYEYNFIMYGSQADLSKVQFMFLGPANDLRESEFSLMGNVETFLDLVIANADRVSPTWIKGQFLPSAYKNLTFSKESCYDALHRIAEAFETEFWVDGKTIHITKWTASKGYTFKHGRFKGLYDLIRTNQNASTIATRLYAYGSEKNLPPDYRNYSKRLKFPGGIDACLPYDVLWTVTDNGNGTQDIDFTWTMMIGPLITVAIVYRLVGSTGPWQYDYGMNTGSRTVTWAVGDYDVRFRSVGGTCANKTTPVATITGTITTPVFPFDPYPYLDQNVALYGVIEHTEIFDDIYPHRTGTVTSVDAGNVFRFYDTSMNFDINAQLLPGLPAKVVFNTGQLAGYEFEISTYNDGTKEFVILKNMDERVLDIPNATIKPGIGDEYVIIDIEMPQTYIDTAENDLLQKALAFLDTKSTPQVSYQLVIDPIYMRDNSYHVTIGDEVWLEDAEFNVLRKIRVVNVTRNLINEYDYQVELADFVSRNPLVQINNALTNQGRNLNNTIRAVLRLRDL